MGQQSNTKRNATLDEKKQRAAGRQQNQEMRQKSGRETAPQTLGAFGEGKKNDSRGRPGSRKSGRMNLRP
jgi:hypothetical protein